MIRIRKMCTDKAVWVTVGSVSVLFSYETPVALRAGDLSCHVTNTWGSGRHMDACGARECGPEATMDTLTKRIEEAIFRDQMKHHVINQLEE